MAGERRLYRDLGGFQVSDFADHYLVGVLSEEGAQTPCEIEADLVVYLHLHDAVDFVFDRILGSEDFDVDGIDLAQGRVKRGRLAATVGPVR